MYCSLEKNKDQYQLKCEKDLMEKGDEIVTNNLKRKEEVWPSGEAGWGLSGLGWLP